MQAIILRIYGLFEKFSIKERIKKNLYVEALKNGHDLVVLHFLQRRKVLIRFEKTRTDPISGMASQFYVLQNY